MSTQISDEQLGEALEAFCKRLVEGHPMLPSGENWEDLDLDIQNKVKTPYLGPLHTAAQVLAKPRVVRTEAELDALPDGSVLLDGGKLPIHKDDEGRWRYGDLVLYTPLIVSSNPEGLPVLHVGGSGD